MRTWHKIPKGWFHAKVSKAPEGSKSEDDAAEFLEGKKESSGDES
jgi:hypothetical protein